MVNDFKYIIKRILIGVGIALVLMYLKGGLILNVNAKSCGYSGTTNQTVVGAIENSVANTYTTTDGMQTLLYTFRSNDNKNISIGAHDYVDLYVPLSMVFSYQPSGSGASQTQQTLNIMGLLCTSNAGCFNATITEGGMTFRIDRDITLSNIRIRASTFYGNWQAQGSRAWFGNIWSINFYDCSDDEALLEEQQKTNDLLESEDSPDTSDLFNNSGVGDDSNSPVSDLITMPLTILQAVNNNASGSCSTWNLGSLFNHNLTMPCINLQNILGSYLYNLIDMAICLFLAYNLGLLCITIYNNLTSLKDDFDDMYTPQHSYKPRHGGDD